jgi:hypothetical protein
MELRKSGTEGVAAHSDFLGGGSDEMQLEIVFGDLLLLDSSLFS